MMIDFLRCFVDPVPYAVISWAFRYRDKGGYEWDVQAIKRALEQLCESDHAVRWKSSNGYFYGSTSGAAWREQQQAERLIYDYLRDEKEIKRMELTRAFVRHGGRQWGKRSTA